MQGAVDDAVRRQVESGVSIVSDGELGKVGYSTYISSGSKASAATSTASCLDLAPLHPTLARKLGRDHGHRRNSPGLVHRAGEPANLSPRTTTSAASDALDREATASAPS